MTTLILACSITNDRLTQSARLRQIRPDWNVIDIGSGKEVLQFLDVNTADCIVSGDLLPDMSGSDLLENVYQKSSDIICYVMAAKNSVDLALENTQIKHHFVDLKTPDNVLIRKIETSVRLRELLSSESLKRYMLQVDTLPSLPDIYQRMVAELSSTQSSLMNVARIIESDIGLTATVLKIINSAFYGLNRRVESVSQGVTLLGAHTMKNITLTTSIFSQFEGEQPDLKKLRLLNDHANKTGALTNQFARLASLPKAMVDQTQVSGMLCNCGQLLAMSMSAKCTEPEEQIPHELLGAYLLKSWHMPDAVIEAVALQSEPADITETVVTPMLIMHAIRYLETQFVDMTDADQLQQSGEYIEQFVGKTLACRWVEAYSDLQQLTSHNDLNNSQAA